MGAGARLKKILDERNLSIKDLSIISDVSLNTLYGITKRDNDTIKNDILQKIASSLGVPPQYILGYDGYAPAWSKDEIYITAEEVQDTLDGLLSRIIAESRKLNTNGRLLVLEYLEKLESQKELLDKEYLIQKDVYDKWKDAEVAELNLMYKEGLIKNHDDLIKSTLMSSRKAFVPYIGNDNDNYYDLEHDRIASLIGQARKRLRNKADSIGLICPFDYDDEDPN